MTKREKRFAIFGGVILVGAVVGVAYAMKKPAIPSGPVQANQPTLTTTSVLMKGKSYGLAAQLPSGITDQASLVSALNAAGWTNVAVVYFGPTASGAVPTVNVPGNAATGYAATGTWSGADNTSIPAGASVVALA